MLFFFLCIYWQCAPLMSTVLLAGGWLGLYLTSSAAVPLSSWACHMPRTTSMPADSRVTNMLCSRWMLCTRQVRSDLQMGRLPPVQPFHAMAYPFSADLALAISQKYAQYCALTASRMRAPQLSHPPARPLAPGERLRIAYVSSDFGNHPLSHLMGSIFGLHDRSKVLGPSWCLPRLSVTVFRGKVHAHIIFSCLQREKLDKMTRQFQHVCGSRKKKPLLHLA